MDGLALSDVGEVFVDGVNGQRCDRAFRTDPAVLGLLLQV